MRVPLSQVNDEQIRIADIIAAVDPTTETYRQLFGQTRLPQIRPYPSGPYTIKILDVEIPSADQESFQHLCQQVTTVKKAQREESARTLAQKHYRIEPAITEICTITSSVSQGPNESIKLLEVNENTVASGIMPLRFDPVPASGIPFASVIVEVTPEEYDRIKRNELRLPDGWSLGPVLPKPEQGRDLE